MPQAASAWRPTIIASGTGGFGHNTLRTVIPANPALRTPTITLHAGGDSPVLTSQAQLTQPVFNGGATVAAVKQAENQVRAQRAQLIAAEQTLFTNTLAAFVSVFANRQLLALAIENQGVLDRELVGARVRFRVGEVTLTDVAQAEAALAGATASRFNAGRDLATATANYRQFVGEPPGPLLPPQPLGLPAIGFDAARRLAATNNPAVVGALFAAAAARDGFDLKFAALLPTASIQLTPSIAINQTLPHVVVRDSQSLLNVNAPVFMGGAEYAAIRQARQSAQQAGHQVTEAQRAAVAQLVSAWENHLAARAATDSTRVQVRANADAFEGVRREMIAGSRTTLDLLNAQQALLGSRQTLVSNTANQVTASYAVAAAVGRLNARDLGLAVPIYDETAYARAVRDAWAGNGP